MKPIIGFAGNGHLMENAAAAAHIKGFERITYTPVRTGDSPEDLQKCDIVYICPDRPGNIEPLAMVDLVLPHLREDAVLVIHCQVEPGFTREIYNKKLRKGIYYHVETLKVSEDTMERALNPERIIIGDPGIGNYLSKTRLKNMDIRLIEFLKSFNCAIICMQYEAAELAKIAINLYLAAQIETSNTLSKVAEKIGVNWNDIIPALQTDKRIGQHAYLKPGEFGKHIQRDVDTIRSIVEDSGQ